MSQTLLAAVDGLETVLTTDADLAQWLTDEAGGAAWTVLKTNRRVNDIGDDELPCLLLELPGGSLGDVVVSGHRQSSSPSLQVTIGFYQKDRDQAFSAKAKLADLVPKAIMADGHGLNDSVNYARASSWETDQGLHHPAHFISFEIDAEYAMAR
jgi:hypothetical protein